MPLYSGNENLKNASNRQSAGARATSQANRMGAAYNRSASSLFGNNMAKINKMQGGAAGKMVEAGANAAYGAKPMARYQALVKKAGIRKGVMSGTGLTKKYQ